MALIRIRGARTHNLKNIDLDIPRDKLVVITGLSGSGKSSLAFDTIYAEGQRRYVESLSSYARQFLSVMEKPDVDHIDGLSPAIAIEQKSTSHNPRSTVGTVTEIYDYLRVLFARVGIPRCPDHGVELNAQTVSQMVDQALARPLDSRWMLLAPVVTERKGEHSALLEQLKSQGFVRIRLNGHVYELDNLPRLDSKSKHTIEVVVDRYRVRADLTQRLAESFETALRLSDGLARIVELDSPQSEGVLFSAQFACPHCGYSVRELEPRLFSFNSPSGACPDCAGIGHQQVFDVQRIVNAKLSIAAGAVRGWDKRNAYYYQMMLALAAHYDFDLEKPFGKLSKRVQDVVLYGSGEEVIAFTYMNERGRARKRRHPFEGIVPTMQRRYSETESETVREELARYLSPQPCPGCAGTRLRREARNVFVAEHTLSALTALPVNRAHDALTALQLPGQRGEIAAKILHELVQRLSFLINVGLDYLSLDRSAETLSGGEAQRIRLASQIGAGLVGVMYVLDEPSIGLHQRDNQRLLQTLCSLRDLGNSVLVVEHDEEAIRAADFVVDIGPGAGTHGGHVVVAGQVGDVIAAPASLTGQYLSGAQSIEIPVKRRSARDGNMITIHGASGNNLKNIDAAIPVGVITCVTGVSGSGKSTLINDTLLRAAAAKINGAGDVPAAHENITGLDGFDRVVAIDQNPIGRTPRSNPATYTGLFAPIRELFAGTSEARARGYTIGRFSFNVRGGRCEACQGDGVKRVEMHFLPDVYVACDECKGKRYNRETLDIHYKGKTINDVLNMTVEEATVFFAAIPTVHRKLETLMEVGLTYITLGQNATTLSGGEAQRIKLAKELSKRDTGNTLYVLDEPTTGLHFHDIRNLLHVLTRLRDQGNTIVVIEHNLDVIKTADWILDLGPEGGERGGALLASGTPEHVARVTKSYTGQFLRASLAVDPALPIQSPPRLNFEI